MINEEPATGCDHDGYRFSLGDYMPAEACGISRPSASSLRRRSSMSSSSSYSLCKCGEGGSPAETVMVPVVCTQGAREGEMRRESNSVLSGL